MQRRTVLKGITVAAFAVLFPQLNTAEAEDMAIFGQFVLKDYTIEDGVWKIHFENGNPGGGNPTDYWAEFALDEIPTNMSQNTLATALKTRLGLTLNQTHAALNTAITNGMTIVLP